MSLSLTPPRGFSFFPGFPHWNHLERDIDRDISRMHRMFGDAAHHFLPDRNGVHHRQPSHTYEENDQQAEIEVEIPGVAKENVTIGFEGDHIAISAKRYKMTPLQSDTTKIDNKQAEDAQVTQDDDVEDDDIQEAPIKQQGTDSATEPSLSVHYKLNIPIGNKFDVDKIVAKMLGDGILTIILPKKVEHATGSRMIQIGST